MEATLFSGLDAAASVERLMLQETIHRCCNDLQLVVSLLSVQSLRSCNTEVKEALGDAKERVAILARARRMMYSDHSPNLNTALLQVCEVLQSQAEPRSIRIIYKAADYAPDLPNNRIFALALVVNELATNSIKHAFPDGRAGFVSVSAACDPHAVTVSVSDNGCPFPDSEQNNGIGEELTRRLMASIGGQLIRPANGSKTFQLTAPAR